LTLLASQAAVAIENARLYENDSEIGWRRKLVLAARAVALLPTELPSAPQRRGRPRGSGAGDERSGLPISRPRTASRDCRGDVSGKESAALYSAFVGGGHVAERFAPRRPTGRSPRRAGLDE
jgi:GAF domain-containing protein